MADNATAHAKAAELIRAYHAIGGKFELFGRQVIPFDKGTDEFYWYLLLTAKPDEGANLISDSAVNRTQSPREECHLCQELLAKAGFDLEYIFTDSTEERVFDVVQIAASNNFLDKKAYKSIAGIKESKMMAFMATHGVVARSSDLPKFLGYDMVVFTNTTDRCIELRQNKPELRNQPATLLTLLMQTLTPEVEIFGKAFAVADDRQLTPEEVREIVIFCMGQAEALELKLTSWEKLRATLQDEARKFVESAQFINYVPK